MNFVQTWIGKMPRSRLKYMKTVLDKVKEGDKYILVSSSPFWKKDSRVEWMSIDEVIEEIWDKYPVLKEHWDEIPLVHRTDFIRIYLASKIEKMFYADTDIVLNKVQKFKKGKPYFAYHLPKHADIFMFYNNDRLDFFEKFMSYVIDLVEWNPFRGFPSDRFYKGLYYFKKKVMDFDKIEDKYYEHRYMTFRDSSRYK